MSKAENIYHFCQGASHKATDKPCQDCAYAESSEALSMAIVSDGHGGARYFRSDRGSKFAVEVTTEAIKGFVDAMKDNNIFKGKPFTAYGVEAQSSGLKDRALDRLTWLTNSIITKWNSKIAEDAKTQPLTDWELQNVDEKYRQEFLLGIQSDTASFEKTYGCTLMAYVRTPDYWFAFHIGDGKAVFFNIVDGTFESVQSIPWDEKCFLNKTTSICDSNAANEFRYCYQGDGTFPVAVFLGSDGIDDTYGDGDILTKFYIKLYKEIANNEKDKVLRMLIRELPKISELGSKDDMSIACIYEDANLGENTVAMVQWSLKHEENRELLIGKNIADLQTKIETFGDVTHLEQKDRINLEYAQKKLEREKANLSKVKSSIHGLKSQIGKIRNQLDKRE